MNTDSVEKALVFVADAWPHQKMTPSAEASWHVVLADCGQVATARKTLQELAAYRQARPHPGEFAELYQAKVRAAYVPEPTASDRSYANLPADYDYAGTASRMAAAIRRDLAGGTECEAADRHEWTGPPGGQYCVACGERRFP